MGPEVGCGDEAGPLTAVHIHLPVRERGGQPVVYSWKEKECAFSKILEIGKN